MAVIRTFFTCSLPALGHYLETSVNHAYFSLFIRAIGSSINYDRSVWFPFLGSFSMFARSRSRWSLLSTKNIHFSFSASPFYGILTLFSTFSFWNCSCSFAILINYTCFWSAMFCIKSALSPCSSLSMAPVDLRFFPLFDTVLSFEVSSVDALPCPADQAGERAIYKIF